MPIQATCDPAEVARIESELATTQSATNVAVGIVDLQTGLIRLFTYDESDAFSRANLHLQVMAGHEAAASMASVPLSQARGFSLGKTGIVWHVFNESHLNRPDGQVNTMRMAVSTFSDVLAALEIAGVLNPIVS